MNPDEHTDIREQIEALWNAHHWAVAKVIATRSRRGAEDPDVQDAVAQAFLRTYRFLDRGGVLGEAFNWLVKVAWNEFLRAQGRRRPDQLTEGDRAWGIVDPAPEPAEVVLDQETAAMGGDLEAALGRLTPRQRALLLEFHAGYTYREISRRHDISWRTVEKQLRKARARLREDGRFGQAYREWSD